jgi:hypothetical protein
MRQWVAAGPPDLVFETGEVLVGGGLVVDIGTIVGPSSRSKYVVVVTFARVERGAER